MVPSDCDCDYDEIAEVASSADLTGDITVSVASLADPVSVVTDGVASNERCWDSCVIPSDSLCDYDDYFYDRPYDDCPDYYDYDSFPSGYDYVGPDDYELYHDLHGSDGCGVYCVARGVVDADVSHWSENRAPHVSHWSDDANHYFKKSDVFLSRTGYDVLPAVFEDGSTATIDWLSPTMRLIKSIQTPPGGLSTTPSTHGQSARLAEPPTEARRPIKARENHLTASVAGGVSLIHTPRRPLSFIVLCLGHISTGPRTIVPARSCPAGCRGF